MKQRFSNKQTAKNVTNVGEMIDELSRLPRDLKIKQGFSPSADLVVFNIRQDDRHLEVTEGGEWDEEADIESQDL